MKILEKFAAELIKLNSPSLLNVLEDINLVDLDANSAEAIISSKYNVPMTIAIGSDIPMGHCLELCTKTSIRHFVQRNRENFFFELFAAALMLKKPATFMKNPAPFFISKIAKEIDSSNVNHSIEISFVASNEKDRVMSEILDFIQKHPQINHFTGSVLQVVDEMMMNALYDAPAGRKGGGMYVDLDRKMPTSLKENEFAKVFLALDQHKLLIGCEDSFGSVNEAKLLKRLHTVYTDPITRPLSGTGGAGLGCKIMIENSSGFYVIVNRYSKTLFCCSMPLGTSFIKAQTLPKHFHYCFF